MTTRTRVGAHLRVKLFGVQFKELGGFIWHHGIYAGRGKVIHFSGFWSSGGKSIIETVSLKEFCGSERYYEEVPYDASVIYQYRVALERAQLRLGETDYCLFTNNCEHFVYWCLTGSSSSTQVQNAASTAGRLSAGAIASRALMMVSPIGLLGVGAAWLAQKTVQRVLD